ncbi:MAG: hypothetical protein AMQ22_01473 [Candidatus Methanofastidiosum methylothiophilum]|uniref:Uncharacterized protein n=1 Tax=Candidatus Methanofastidiosum methylothiophilum TaxID=1705564 RepID=A0A150IZA1_9EURY|nr:MAG: hypothetical protein AMQ22_01473 [Candidatus Methanofastidiosum methylthiophilus]
MNLNNQNEEKLLVVHENEVESFLKSINEYENITNSKVNCSVCNVVINIDNFGLIIKQNGRYHYSCDKKECANIFKIKMRSE